MIYGGQLLSTYARVRALGLTTSREAFSVEWWARGPYDLRDFTRRRGAMARVSPHTVGYLRSRLAEAACLLPSCLAAEIQIIDSLNERDCRIARIVGRWATRV